MALRPDGFWGMGCWNGLSPDQREFLRTQGYLPLGYEPQGDCPKGAEVEVTTMMDEFPGPRFYCRACAVAYLQGLLIDEWTLAATRRLVSEEPWDG